MHINLPSASFLVDFNPEIRDAIVKRAWTRSGSQQGSEQCKVKHFFPSISHKETDEPYHFPIYGFCKQFEN